MIQSKLLKSLNTDHVAQPSQTLTDLWNYSDLHASLAEFWSQTQNCQIQIQTIFMEIKYWCCHQELKCNRNEVLSTGTMDRRQGNNLKNPSGNGLNATTQTWILSKANLQKFKVRSKNPLSSSEPSIRLEKYPFYDTMKMNLDFHKLLKIGKQQTKISIILLLPHKSKSEKFPFTV